MLATVPSDSKRPVWRYDSLTSRLAYTQEYLCPTSHCVCLCCCPDKHIPSDHPVPHAWVRVYWLNHTLLKKNGLRPTVMAYPRIGKGARPGQHRANGRTLPMESACQSRYVVVSLKFCVAQSGGLGSQVGGIYARPDAVDKRESTDRPWHVMFV